MGTIDMNIKTGQGWQGDGTDIDKDGDKQFRTWKEKQSERATGRGHLPI